jgi:hypothetical protein
MDRLIPVSTSLYSIPFIFSYKDLDVLWVEGHESPSWRSKEHFNETLFDLKHLSLNRIHQKASLC